MFINLFLRNIFLKLQIKKESNEIIPFVCMYKNSGYLPGYFNEAQGTLRRSYLYVSNYLFVLNIWTIQFRAADSIYSLYENIIITNSLAEQQMNLLVRF